MNEKIKLTKIHDYLWEIPKRGGMRVPGRLYASEKMLEVIKEDKSLEQIVNVAHLPGIQKYSIAMPDIHWGYGFPIGGIAAMDVEEGVISPGGVGYDINCLTGETLVLHPFGFTLPIEDYIKRQSPKEVLTLDVDKQSVLSAEVCRFISQRPKNSVYELITETGKRIRATAEHPVLTPSGMKRLDDIEPGEGEPVTTFSFYGVPYEEPPDETIIDEDSILEALTKFGKGEEGNAKGQILNKIKELGLIPLTYRSPKLPLILKIMGFLFGDGTMNFNGKHKKGAASFYGKPEDLEEIRKDIKALGFTPSRIYKRDKTSIIHNSYRKYEFERTETWFKVVGSAFTLFFAALGTPVGNKAKSDFAVPKWLGRAPLWQKRLLLAPLFGAELTTPSAFEKRNYNFKIPILGVNKRVGFVESGKEYLKGISSLLEDFGVQIKKISERREKLPDGEITVRFRLIMSSRGKSLANLWGRIGIEYNAQKRAIASIASAYIALKEAHIMLRKDAEEQILKARAVSGGSAAEIHEALSGCPVNLRFVERTLLRGKKVEPRVSEVFPTFREFIEERTKGLGFSGCVWEKVVEKRKLDYIGLVYDFTVDHRDHNFIAGGIVVSNCGVRLMRTHLTEEEVRPKLRELVTELYNRVPCGVGVGGKIKLSNRDYKDLIEKGAKWAIERGWGEGEDLERIEDYGTFPGGALDAISQKAFERGKDEIGTLGSGNHFLEVDVVDQIYNPGVADAFGLFKDQVCVHIHCGSRGFGHQICTDYIDKMLSYMRREGIVLPDRQLACAHIKSKEGRDYLSAFAAAVNYAWTNRQIIMAFAREAFYEVFRMGPKDLGGHLIYDVSHNIAKFEEHKVNGETKKVCVHRKGATRAFPKGHPLIPEIYRDVGQPVFIPGDMGRASFVLVGTEATLDETFGSSCHGAGRLLSRNKALKIGKGRNLFAELEEKGIIVMARGKRTVAEEMPEAYKEAEEVCDIVHNAGIAKKVARLRPIGVVKG